MSELNGVVNSVAQKKNTTKKESTEEILGVATSVADNKAKSTTKVAPPKAYKQTKVGIIPQDWDIVKIESISDFITKGATPTTYGFNWQEDGIPFLRSECVSDNGLNLKAAMYICQDAHNVMRRSAITSGDILMTITGNVGRVVLLENFKEGNINQHIARIRIIEKLANRNFIFSFLSQSTYQTNYFKITTGQAYPQLSLVQVRDSLVSFPPLKEQEKIAEILTTWDNAIIKQQELIKSKDEQKKGLMQKLLSGEVRFDGFSDVWEEVKINQIFEITRGYVLSVTEMRQEKTEEYKYPVYSSQTKNNGLTGYYKEYLFENCITWTTDGANAGDVNLRKGSFYCTNVCGVLKSDKGYANQCIAEILNSVTRNYVSYVGNPKLMNNVMGGIKIKIPKSIFEQQKIAEVLSLADEEINNLKNELKEQKQQKKALMQKLLTGQVRVNV